MNLPHPLELYKIMISMVKYILIPVGTHVYFAFFMTKHSANWRGLAISILRVIFFIIMNNKVLKVLMLQVTYLTQINHVIRENAINSFISL